MCRRGGERGVGARTGGHESCRGLHSQLLGLLQSQWEEPAPRSLVTLLTCCHFLMRSICLMCQQFRQQSQFF